MLLYIDSPGFGGPMTIDIERRPAIDFSIKPSICLLCSSVSSLPPPTLIMLLIMSADMFIIPLENDFGIAPSKATMNGPPGRHANRAPGGVARSPAAAAHEPPATNSAAAIDMQATVVIDVQPYGKCAQLLVRSCEKSFVHFQIFGRHLHGGVIRIRQHCLHLRDHLAGLGNSSFDSGRSRHERHRLPADPGVKRTEHSDDTLRAAEDFFQRVAIRICRDDGEVSFVRNDRRLGPNVRFDDLGSGVGRFKLPNEFLIVGDRNEFNPDRRGTFRRAGHEGQNGGTTVVDTRMDPGVHFQKRQQTGNWYLHFASQLRYLFVRLIQVVNNHHRQGIIRN